MFFSDIGDKIGIENKLLLNLFIFGCFVACWFCVTTYLFTENENVLNNIIYGSYIGTYNDYSRITNCKINPKWLILQKK
jgi:hypothetical protein